MRQPHKMVKHAQKIRRQFADGVKQMFNTQH